MSDRDHHEHSDGLLGKLKHLVRPHSHDAADSVDNELEGSADGITGRPSLLFGRAR